MKQSPAARAIATGPARRLYLMGYVAAIAYCHPMESEIILTKNGHWSSMWPRHKSEEGHVWPTREEAAAAAQQQIPGKHAVYTRGYIYETHQPCDLPLLKAQDTERVYLYQPQSQAA